MSDEAGLRALQDVWGWMVNGPEPLEEYTTTQLQQLKDTLHRAEWALRSHIARRGGQE